LDPDDGLIDMNVVDNVSEKIASEFLETLGEEMHTTT